MGQLREGKLTAQRKSKLPWRIVALFPEKQAARLKNMKL